MNLDLAIEKIDKIKSEIDLAFERGTIDFDLIDAELAALKRELESVDYDRVDKLSEKKKASSGESFSPQFIPRESVHPEDYR